MDSTCQSVNYNKFSTYLHLSGLFLKYYLIWTWLGQQDLHHLPYSYFAALLLATLSVSLTFSFQFFMVQASCLGPSLENSELSILHLLHSLYSSFFHFCVILKADIICSFLEIKTIQKWIINWKLPWSYITKITCKFLDSLL